MIQLEHKLSQRTAALQASPTTLLDTRAKQLKAEGVDVINLSVGEPDFDTITSAKEGGIKAIQEGFTRYTAPAGAMELRRAIADKLRIENGLHYEPEQIVVSNGGKQALYNAFTVLLDPGDEVIIQAPYWVTYPEQVRLCGGTPVIIETGAETGYKMTPEMIRRTLTSNTKALVLNTPCNPTGVMYTPAELEAIAQLAVEHSLYIITDELYEKLVYGDIEHRSIASFGEEIKRLTLVINGVSKGYAMTGWRLGYSASDLVFAKAMSNLQSQTTGNPSSISQMAALAGLHGDPEAIEHMRQAFAERRRFVLDRLEHIPGFSMEYTPEGAFYVFPNVTGTYGMTVAGRTIRNADDLSLLLLEEANVAVVSGIAFGAPDHIRISYTVSMDDLQHAFERIEALLQQ